MINGQSKTKLLFWTFRALISNFFCHELFWLISSEYLPTLMWVLTPYHTLPTSNNAMEEAIRKSGKRRKCQKPVFSSFSTICLSHRRKISSFEPDINFVCKYFHFRQRFIFVVWWRVYAVDGESLQQDLFLSHHCGKAASGLERIFCGELVISIPVKHG